LVVLMIGTNNYQDNTAEEIVEGIEAVVQRLKNKLPNTNVLLMGLLPRNDAREATREMFAEINKRISKLADDKTVFFLDLSNKFLTKDGALDTNLMPDLVHPGAKGFEVWAEAIEPYVARFLNDSPRVSGAGGSGAP
jgi:lysophospholipase L1-like esterase